MQFINFVGLLNKGAYFRWFEKIISHKMVPGIMNSVANYIIFPEKSAIFALFNVSFAVLFSQNYFKLHSYLHGGLHFPQTSGFRLK